MAILLLEAVGGGYGHHIWCVIFPALLICTWEGKPGERTVPGGGGEHRCRGTELFLALPGLK